MANTNKHDWRPTVGKVFKQKKDRTGTVISAEDALNQGKIKFTGAAFGPGVSPDYVYCNLDFDEVLMIAHLVLSGTFAKVCPPNQAQSFSAEGGTYHVAGEYTAYKGSPKSEQYNGQPESRIIEIRAIAFEKNGVTQPRYSISMWFGPGKKTATGAIMPDVSRSQMVSQRMYLTPQEMVRLFLKLKLHIESYYKDHYTTMYDRSDGSYIKGFRNDVFTDPNAPRHPVEYVDESTSTEEYGADTAPEPEGYTPGPVSEDNPDALSI